VTFVAGDHVSLRLPTALLHGVDATRVPCIVLQEVSPQYYCLLSESGILDTFYRPGSLQPLVGHTFSAQTKLAYNDYLPGMRGNVTIGAVVRSLTGKYWTEVIADTQSPLQSRSLVHAGNLVSPHGASVKRQECLAPFIAIMVSASATTLQQQELQRHSISQTALRARLAIPSMITIRGQSNSENGGSR